MTCNGNVSREIETFKNQKEMLEISTLWENEERLWGVHQETGDSQEKNQWALQYVHRNFLNWNARRKSNEEQKPKTEYPRTG